MNGILERPVTHRHTVHGSNTASEWNTPQEMVIDFERMVWTCTEHNEVMRLDSGEDCPRCRGVT